MSVLLLCCRSRALTAGTPTNMLHAVVELFKETLQEKKGEVTRPMYVQCSIKKEMISGTILCHAPSASFSRSRDENVGCLWANYVRQCLKVETKRIKKLLKEICGNKRGQLSDRKTAEMNDFDQ